MRARSDIGRFLLRSLLALLCTRLPRQPRRRRRPVRRPTPSSAGTSFASSAEKLVADESASTEALEDLRDGLVAQRSEIIAVEQRNQPAVDELNQRLQALGPAPAEGIEEAPEIANLRRDLNRKIADAQAPVLAAQEAHRRVDALVNADRPHDPSALLRPN